MKWTTKDIGQLKRLWNNKVKIREIAEKMGRTQPSIVSKVSEMQKKGLLSYRHKDGGKKRRKIQVANLSRKMPTKLKLSDSKEYKALMGKIFNSTQDKIANECDMIKAFLVQKNQAYGDSALAPIRIFSRADASEQLKVRIDDKLNRLMQGDSTIEADEDVVKDLIGYLVLLLIQMKEA